MEPSLQPDNRRRRPDVLNALWALQSVLLAFPFFVDDIRRPWKFVIVASAVVFGLGLLEMAKLHLQGGISYTDAHNYQTIRAQNPRGDVNELAEGLRCGGVAALRLQLLAFAIERPAKRLQGGAVFVRALAILFEDRVRFLPELGDWAVDNVIAWARRLDAILLILALGIVKRRSVLRRRRAFGSESGNRANDQ